MVLPFNWIAFFYSVERKGCGNGMEGGSEGRGCGVIMGKGVSLLILISDRVTEEWRRKLR